jgi:hypothetical protein
LKKACDQNPAKVRKWLKDECPSIKDQAKREDAEIYKGDETGIRTDAQHEWGYAPKGKTPVIQLNAKRESTNMISAISNQGKGRFQIYDDTMSADKLIGFKMWQIKDAKRKVILILDNLRVYYSGVVKAWHEKTEIK